MTKHNAKLADTPPPVPAGAVDSLDSGTLADPGQPAPVLQDNQPQSVVFEIARLITAATDNLCIIRGISARGAIIHTSCQLERGQRVTIEVRSGEQIGGIISATFPVGSSVWFDKPAEVTRLLAGARAAGARGRPRLPRLSRVAPVTIEAGEQRVQGSICNISMAGACIELTQPGDMSWPKRVAIRLDGLGVVGCAVRWQKGARIGVKFDRPAQFKDLEAWLNATLAPPASSEPDAASMRERDGIEPWAPGDGVVTMIRKEVPAMNQSGTAARRRKADHAAAPAPTRGRGIRRERRGHKRVTTVFRLAKLLGDREELCLIRNVSASGLKAEVFSSKSIGERLAIDFGDRQPQPARVAWVEDGYVGIAFDDHIDVVHTLENVPAPGDRRARRLRFLVALAGFILVGRRYAGCRLIDISQGGARIRTDAALEPGDRVRVTVDDRDALVGTVLWTRDGDAGIGFAAPLAYRELAGWIVNHGAIATPEPVEPGSADCPAK